jgi:hypothetical protein
MAKRYQGCNQNMYIIEEQTTQWPKDTNGWSESVNHWGTHSTMAKRYQGIPPWYLLAICSSMIYRFWLPPWYLLAICSSMIYRFWLLPCYILAIVRTDGQKIPWV